MFKHLRGSELRRLVALMRFPDDRVRREEFEHRKAHLHFRSALWLKQHPADANPDRMTAAEVVELLRADRRAGALVRLKKMEEHYADVARLDATEVERRLSAAAPRDPGVSPYKRALVRGEDPRRRTALEILRQIPIARRRLEQGQESWELAQIERLNALANGLLTAPHTRRGLNVEADKVLWVEGPNDVPVFGAWLSKCPERGNQVLAILPLAGHQSASHNFDLKQLLSVNSCCLIILDSERTKRSGRPELARLKAARKMKAHDIPHLLTERRATENYYPSKALAVVCKGVPTKLDHFAELSKQVPEFSKRRHGALVAQAMDWSDIADTDIGRALSDFLK